jgi:hypothetical protein
MPDENGATVGASLDMMQKFVFVLRMQMFRQIHYESAETRLVSLRDSTRYNVVMVQRFAYARKISAYLAITSLLATAVASCCA